MFEGRETRRGRGAGFGRRGRRCAECAVALETLADLRPGQEARIAEISDDRARAQAMRFGMGTGACVHCVSRLPGGPVILRSGRQEIAVGRGLAGRIRVQAPSEVVA